MPFFTGKSSAYPSPRSGTRKVNLRSKFTFLQAAASLPVPGYCSALFHFWNGKGNNISLFPADVIPLILHSRDAFHLPVAHCHGWEQIYFYHIQASIGAAMHRQEKWEAASGICVFTLHIWRFPNVLAQHNFFPSEGTGVKSMEKKLKTRCDKTGVPEFFFQIGKNGN